MKTTLNKIREHNPCKNGWEKLLKHLGKTKADDEPLSLLTILDSNGLDDALWCLRAVDGYEKEMRLHAVWCARQVQHFMTDQKSIEAVDFAERYAQGQATDKELKVAWEAAFEAARASAWRTGGAAAWYAASNTAWMAASDAACVAARVSAWAARDAARDAAYDAARVSAWEAARASAWDAAYDAASAEQETEFRRMLNAIEDYAQCA